MISIKNKINKVLIIPFIMSVIFGLCSFAFQISETAPFQTESQLFWVCAFRIASLALLVSFLLLLLISFLKKKFNLKIKENVLSIILCVVCVISSFAVVYSSYDSSFESMSTSDSNYQDLSEDYKELFPYYDSTTEAIGSNKLFGYNYKTASVFSNKYIHLSTAAFTTLGSPEYNVECFSTKSNVMMGQFLALKSFDNGVAFERENIKGYIYSNNGRTVFIDNGDSCFLFSITDYDKIINQSDDEIINTALGVYHKLM